MLKRGEKCNVELSSEQIILLRLLVVSVAGSPDFAKLLLIDQMSDAQLGDRVHYDHGAGIGRNQDAQILCTRIDP